MLGALLICGVGGVVEESVRAYSPSVPVGELLRPGDI